MTTKILAKWTGLMVIGLVIEFVVGAANLANAQIMVKTPIPNPVQRQWGQAGDIPVPGHYLGPFADLAVWRPSNGVWYIQSYSTAAVRTQQWGQYGDIPMPGDYDGDGLTDFAVWRPANGTWYVLSSSTGIVRQQQWGLYGDIPVPGDYDGDHISDFAVWRPRDGNWWIIGSATGVIRSHQWGQYGDVPVPANNDAHIVSSFVVWRAAARTVYSMGNDWLGYQSGFAFGDTYDVPLAAPFLCAFQGTDFAVWRPTTGEWFESGTVGGQASVVLGRPGDIPVPANYTGSKSAAVGGIPSGAADFAVWRPSNGTWYIRQNLGGCVQ